jgi:hypothetical protein
VGSGFSKSAKSLLVQFGKSALAVLAKERAASDRSCFPRGAFLTPKPGASLFVPGRDIAKKKGKLDIGEPQFMAKLREVAALAAAVATKAKACDARVEQGVDFQKFAL